MEKLKATNYVTSWIVIVVRVVDKEGFSVSKQFVQRWKVYVKHYEIDNSGFKYFTYC